MVSARMPKSLVKELKQLVKEQHYLDLSEQIRSVLRKKWIQYTNPQLYEIKELRKDISKEVKKRSVEKVQEQVNKELKKISERLKKGGILDV